MFRDWSIESLLFPLLDVLEVMFFMEWCVGNKSIFVGEDEFLVIYVLSFKTQIIQFWLDRTVFINVSIDSSNTMFVGPIQIANGLPNLFLNFKVILEVIDDLVISCNCNLIVILTQLFVNVLCRVWILVWKIGIFFIIDFSVSL